MGGDALGSTRSITDSSQSVSDTKRYDAFGMLVASTGSNPTPFGFAGGSQYQTDADSGLMLLGHRYFDCSIGRFISTDPAKSGTNWYAYTENDPLGGMDPSGLDDGKHITKPMSGAVGDPDLWKIIPDPKNPSTPGRNGAGNPVTIWHMVAVDQYGNEFSPGDGSLPEEWVTPEDREGEVPPPGAPGWISNPWQFPRFDDPMGGVRGSKRRLKQYYRRHKGDRNTLPMDPRPTTLVEVGDGTIDREAPTDF